MSDWSDLESELRALRGDIDDIDSTVFCRLELLFDGMARRTDNALRLVSLLREGEET